MTNVFDQYYERTKFITKWLNKFSKIRELFDKDEKMTTKTNNDPYNWGYYLQKIDTWLENYNNYRQDIVLVSKASNPPYRGGEFLFTKEVVFQSGLGQVRFYLFRSHKGYGCIYYGISDEELFKIDGNKLVHGFPAVAKDALKEIADLVDSVYSDSSREEIRYAICPKCGGRIGFLNCNIRKSGDQSNLPSSQTPVVWPYKMYDGISHPFWQLTTQVRCTRRKTYFNYEYSNPKITEVTDEASIWYKGQ